MSRLRISLDSIYKYLSFIHNRESIKTYIVAISIIAAITTLQLTSTVFLGLSSSPSSSSGFLSKTADVASSSDALTDTITARSTAAGSTSSYTKIIRSAVAQEEGDAGDGVGGDEFISEPEEGGEEGEDVGGGEEGVPVEGGDTGTEQVGPTTTTRTTTTELKCDDGIDDDADGLIDLDDTQDCPFQAPLPSTSTSTNASTDGTENLSMQAAEEQMPPTSEFVSPQAQTEEFCGDNVDNNGNGQIDEGCPDLGAETPPATATPSPTPPLTCPPGQDREPDTNECAPLPGVFTPSPVPGLTPTPQQQPILPPLTPSQPEGSELGTAGPAFITSTPTPTPCPPGQGREPDTNECAPLPTLTPSPVPSPDQQPILPPLTPSQPEGSELGTAGPAVITPTPTPCPQGQDREPDTNECAPIPTLTPSPSPALQTATPCPPGQGPGPEGCGTDMNMTRGFISNGTAPNIECIPKGDRNDIAKIKPSALWTAQGFFKHISNHNCLPPEYGRMAKGEPIGTAIVVTTVVSNDDGRTNRPSDFTFVIHNNGQQMASRRGQGPPGVNIPLQAGSVNVVTGSYADYTEIRSEGCASPIRNGEILRCTLYYDDRPRSPPPRPTTGNAALVITKKFIGGPPISNTESVVQVFTYANSRSPPCRLGNVQGCVDARPFSEFSGPVHPGRVVNIPPGFYSVREEPIPDYNPHYSAECYSPSGTEPVTAGQVRYCTIYNIYAEGFGARRLTITNIVFNDNGGTKHPSDFRFSLSTSNNRNIEVSIPASSNRRIQSLPTPQEIGQVTRSVLMGAYQVTQQEDPRYFTTLSPDCLGAISGQPKRCTIYNDDKPSSSVAGRRAPPPPQPPGIASVKVITRIVNDNGGTATLDNFRTIICGGAPLNRDLRIHGITIPRLNPCPQGPSAVLQSIALLLGAGSDARGPPGKVIYLQPGSNYMIIGLGPFFSGSVPRQQYETSSECRGTAQVNQAQVCLIVHDDKPR